MRVRQLIIKIFKYKTILIRLVRSHYTIHMLVSSPSNFESILLHFRKRSTYLKDNYHDIAYIVYIMLFLIKVLFEMYFLKSFKQVNAPINFSNHGSKSVWTRIDIPVRMVCGRDYYAGLLI